MVAEHPKEGAVKKLLQEYKEFIDKGDVVTVAVGLVLALYFKTIIDKIIEGVITPIIAAIVGESDLYSWGFDIGDAFISVGAVVAAIVDFLVVAAILFFIVKAYNKLRRAEASEAGPSEIDLLTEIRDSLRNR
jgi:large conductance mechanosensitive channel